MTQCQYAIPFDPTLFTSGEKVMQRWLWRSRIIARFSLRLAVLSRSPTWTTRLCQHAVSSFVAVTALLLLPLTPQAIVPAAASGCQLQSAQGDIQHVIYLIFDNVHFLRDNPNVPSDLEQMPNLLNFIRHNGTLLTNDHTVLISHTANGILSSLTGVYPDRMGQPVSNSFRYFTPSGTSRTGVSFAYWTSPLYDPAGPPFPPAGQTDFTHEMINENGNI